MDSSLSDIVGEILKRVDGTTLAKLACSSSDFMSLANEECLWENMCSSLWPSTKLEEVKRLISSLGGFRKFYADCFVPLNACSKHSEINFKKNNGGSFNVVPDDYLADAISVSSSDFVPLVDLSYDNKPILSKVIEKDCVDNYYSRSISNFPVYPFLIDLVCNCDGIVPSITIKRQKDVESQTFLLNKMRVSWIMINTRTQYAVNLSSWKPLIARKKCLDREDEFVVGFGGLVRSQSCSPLDLVSCNITVNCRISNGEGGSNMKLQISEIRLQMEDELGNQLNSRDSILFTIQKEMNVGRRIKEHRCDGLLQNNLTEEKKQPTLRFMLYPIWLPFSVAVITVFLLLLSFDSVIRENETKRSNMK